MLESVFSQFSVFGFSGSRSGVPSGCFPCVPLVPAGSKVFVGCANGVDAFFRSQFPTASVFAAASFGSGRGSFAARSVAVVRAVAVSGGLWVSFPSSPCPTGLQPSSSQSKCFRGLGSGSWASLAFALGLGVPGFPLKSCWLGFVPRPCLHWLVRVFQHPQSKSGCYCPVVLVLANGRSPL